MAKIEINMEHGKSPDELALAGYDPDHFPYKEDGHLHENHLLNTGQLMAQGYTQEASEVHGSNRNRLQNMERRALKDAVLLAGSVAVNRTIDLNADKYGVFVTQDEHDDMLARRQDRVAGS